MTEENTVEEEAKVEAPKPKGRPRKQAESAPKAVEEEPKTEEVEESAPDVEEPKADETVVNKPDFEINGDHADDKAVNHAVEESNKEKGRQGKPEGRIAEEGEDIEVETEEVGGVFVATETVYREVSTLGSDKKAYFLVAQKGTPYYKQTTILL